MPGVAKLLQEHFVGLASDCDDPEPEIADLVSTHLADGMMLPFVLFTDADGRFLAGSHGVVDPRSFQKVVTSLAGT